jgi:hypothetical protein
MNEYERYECDKCAGKGKYYKCGEYSQTVPFRCSNCNGEGYLDWIENIVGKRPPERLESYWDSSSYIQIDKTAAQVAILHPRGHGKTAFLEAQQLIDREIIQVMSNKIAMEIDKLIIDELCGKEKG